MFGECHAHIFMNGYDYQLAVRNQKNGNQEKVIRENLKAYQEKGITFVRDGGDHFGASALAKRLAKGYGIDYRSPLYSIYKNGHYGKVTGRGFDNMKEYEKLVDKAILNGADFIKIMVSGIMDFNKGGLTEDGLKEEYIKEMIHIAHEKGKAIMVHANGAKTILTCVKAGADSIEHGNYMDEECIAALIEHKADTAYVPTVVTIRNLIGDGRFPDEIIKPIWERQKEVINSLYQGGATIALGSDAGAYRVLHGQGVEDEFKAIAHIAHTTTSGKVIKARMQAGEEFIKERFKA